MIIDCERCEMRDIACDDCVVTALLGAVPNDELGGETATALRVLADGGLVPPLRMRLPDAASGWADEASGQPDAASGWADEASGQPGAASG